MGGGGNSLGSGSGVGKDRSVSSPGGRCGGKKLTGRRIGLLQGVQSQPGPAAFFHGD